VLADRAVKRTAIAALAFGRRPCALVVVELN
jgi:hypothetical protein